MSKLSVILRSRGSDPREHQELLLAEVAAGRGERRKLPLRELQLEVMRTGPKRSSNASLSSIATAWAKRLAVTVN